MSEFNMEELDNKIENINYKGKINKIEEDLNRVIQRLGIKLYENAIKQNKFPIDNLTKLINYIKKFKEGKIEHKPKTVYRFIVGYYNKNIKNKLKETIDQEAPGTMRNNLERIYDKILQPIEEEETIKGVNYKSEEETKQPKPEEEPKQKKPIKLLSSSESENEDEEPEEEEPEQPKIKKEINYKINELLNIYPKISENPEYIAALGPSFFKLNVEDVFKKIKDLKENIKKYDPETAYKKYKDIVFLYNAIMKHNIKVDIAMSKNEERKIILNEILSLLPDLEIKKPEPEQQPKPEQPIKGINSTWTQPPLNERITRPNPDAPPTTTVSTTPIDDFTEPKQKKTIKLLSSSGSEYEEEEEEPEQQPAAQQLVPVNNSQQIVQSPKENFKIAERDIKEFKNNPQLDIIKGVGDVIEFIATSNLTPEMTDELIDQMLDLKDSHGNLLFNNRFQIEDLIINRMKRRRIKYLLPKRIIRAEKPDEQKLIINPMLRRGRIASMTSAKERYYNYI